MFVKLLKNRELSKFISRQPQLENIVRNLLVRRVGQQKSQNNNNPHLQVNLNALLSKTQAKINTAQQQPKSGQYWFKRKTIGYGWTPASREGWLVTFLYMGVIFWLVRPALFEQMEQEIFWDWFIPKFLLATAILIFICYKTGEKRHK